MVSNTHSHIAQLWTALWPLAMRVAIALVGVWLVAEYGAQFNRALTTGSLEDADRTYWQMVGASFLSAMLIVALPFPLARKGRLRLQLIPLGVVVILVIAAAGFMLYAASPSGYGRFGVSPSFEWGQLGLPYLAFKLGLQEVPRLSAPLVSALVGALVGRTIVDQLR